LSDSAFASASKFPKLNRKAKLIHPVHDLGLSAQTADEEIYQKAIENKCLILTINFKDFRRFVRHSKSGVIGINSQLSNADIDKLVTNFISGKNPDNFFGKAMRI